MTPTTRARGVFLVLLLSMGVLIGACASDESSRISSPVSALARAVVLARTDARLAALLVPRPVGDGFEREGGAFTSPGWRGAKDKRWNELGSRVPLHADGALEVGASQLPALRLRLVPRGAEGVAGELRDGHVVFPGAYGASVDVVVLTTPDSVEELFMLRERTARMSFAWDVELPSGIARAVLHADGALVFEDGRGQHVMHVAAPYAVDARGEKRAAMLSWDATTRRLGVELDPKGLAFPVLLDPAIETTSWETVKTPSVRTGAALAYDASRGRVVLFGGVESSAGVFGDTWTWDGVTWVLVSPAASPPARWGSAMAYDAARGRVILHGGLGVNGRLNDTWTWDGAVWAPASPAVSPPARYGHALAYDPSRGRVILFGGSDANDQRLNDTWSWDGTTWTNASAGVSPPARLKHGMTYDAARGRVVLFGGSGASDNLGDTWTWDGTWTQAAPAAAPSKREGHGLAYDAVRNRVVLFGGSNPTDDTWTWDGTAWTQILPATVPPARFLHSMVYDAARGGVSSSGASAPAVL